MMGIAEWILVVLVALPFVNLLWLAIYCRIERRIDLIREQKKQERKQNKRSEEDMLQEKGSEQGDGSKQRKIYRVYAGIDHYFYGWMRYSILLIGRVPSSRIRNWIYRHVLGMQITKKTVISGGCEIRSPWNIQANNCVIASGCLMDGRRGIIIGENVVFGANVHIWTEEHDVNDAWFSVTEEHAQPVVIGSHAWICSDSTILPGINVGEGAVIATKACVTKNCEDFGIYGGVPAKKIGERNHDLRYELSGKPHWHFY